jgi:hypothetical protein
MEDARHLTDYRTATRREEFVKYVNNIVRNDDYRLFLQKNANNLMDSVWDYHKSVGSCPVNECVHTYPTRVYPPWFVEERMKYDSLFDPSRKEKYACAPRIDYRLNENKQ